jgi:hypothetical protein
MKKQIRKMILGGQRGDHVGVSLATMIAARAAGVDGVMVAHSVTWFLLLL